MIAIPIDEQVVIDCTKEWTATAQLFVAVEECGEFVQAAMKYENRNGDVEHLMEEAADVLFLMLQMRYIVGEENFDKYLERTINKVSKKLYGE